MLYSWQFEELWNWLIGELDITECCCNMSDVKKKFKEKLDGIIEENITESFYEQKAGEDL